MSATDRLVKWLMKDYGHVGVTPTQFVIAPEVGLTTIPMTLPGDRVWQGIQLDNEVTGLIQPANYLGRNPFTTSVEKSERISLTTGMAGMNQNSQGPAMFAELLRISTA